MKSHFLRIFILLTVFLPQLLPAQTFVGSYTSEGDPVYYEIFSTINKTCTTKTGTDEASGHVDLRGSLIIPEVVSYNGDDYKVTRIGTYSFANCISLTDYNLPNTITFIGQGAFSGCVGLNCDIIIPSSLTQLDANAFQNCSSLTGTLDFPDGLKSIGSYAFYHCSNLTGELQLPSSISSIYEHTFDGCRNLTSLTFPSNLRSIGQYAFGNCLGLSCTLDFPTSLRSIGAAAFLNCSNLTGDLIISDNIITLSSNAFEGCSGFDGELILSASLTEIEAHCFSGCSKIHGRLIIPETVTNIRNSAFNGCKSFTGNLSFPETLTHIGNAAFAGCSGFTGDLIFPENLKAIDTDAFKGCSGFDGILRLPYNLTQLGSSSFQNCSNLTGDLTIPDGITMLQGYTFNKCSGFNGRLTLPINLTTIGGSDFNGCSGLIGDLIIPDGVKSLPSYVFQGCKNLDGKLKLPENLKSIGSYTFSDCSSLIGDLILPNTVTSIGVGAFSGCSGFNGTLTLSEKLTTISNGCFQNCSGLIGNIVFPPNLTTISAYAFYGCSGLTGNLKFPENLQEIGGLSFNGCKGLRGDLIIPDGVKSLGTYTFQNCANLGTTCILSQNMTSVGKYVFTGCNIITTYIMPKVDVPEADATSFPTLTPKAKLYVPAEAVDDYKAAEGWRNLEIEALVECESISLSKNRLYMNLGASEQLTATIEPEDITDPRIFWESSDPAVAAVDAQGRVTLLTDGVAEITARCGVQVAVCQVAKYVPVSALKLSEEAASVIEGRELALVATVDPENATYPQVTWESSDPAVATGLQMSDESMTLTPDASKKLTVTIQPENTTDRSVTWKSSNPAVAAVDSEGNVTALAVGTATITATSHNGLTATCDVTVEPVEAATIELSHTVLTMDCADKVTLTATVLPENTTDKTVTWESSNPAVAEVDSEGNVTALAAGTATITATCGNATATCEVTVNPVEAREVRLSDTELSLYCGDTHQLTTTVLPEYTTDKTVTWESSNPAVATVSLAGLVTAADRGQAIVTATCGSVSTTCIVTVSYQRVIINGIEYELNPTTDPATASVCGGKPDGGGQLNLPSPIQWNDVEYNVISIAPLAFADDAITSVVLPETMQSVGNQAFVQCPNIATVTALSTTPPTMDDDGFAADVYRKAQLKVVGSAVTDYQNAPGWQSFATIKDKDGGLTGIADAATTDAVTIRDGKITAHTTIKVLTLNGLTIATLSEGTTIDTLPAGYYIIVAPGCAIKVRL